MSTSIKTNLINPVNDLHESENRWFAVYTKYKAEKLVIKNLLKKGIEAYTPLLKTTKKYSRKVKTYDIPLLNCYVFVKICKKDYVKVLETQYVVNFVKIRKNLISIPTREINLMKRIVGEFEDVRIADRKYVKGDRVEIVSGKLTGLQGRLININNKKDFLITLEKSGYQLLININPQLIRPIGQVLV